MFHLSYIMLITLVVFLQIRVNVAEEGRYVEKLRKYIDIYIYIYAGAHICACQLINNGYSLITDIVG